MKKAKRILAVFLILVMSLSLFPAQALAEDLQEEPESEPANEAAMTEESGEESEVLTAEEGLRREACNEEAASETENSYDIPQMEIPAAEPLEEETDREEESSEADEQKQNIPGESPADEPAETAALMTADDGEGSPEINASGQPQAEAAPADAAAGEEPEEVILAEEYEDPQAITVIIRTEPAEAVLNVYTLTDGQKQLHIPYEEGSYLLEPGEYFYDVHADGYESLERQQLIVESSEEPIVVESVLTAVIEVEPETEEGRLQEETEEVMDESTSETEDPDSVTTELFSEAGESIEEKAQEETGVKEEKTAEEPMSAPRKEKKAEEETAKNPEEEKEETEKESLISSAKAKDASGREAMDAAASGTCGPNLTWSFNTETGVLTISGSGEMTSHPWSNNYQTAIRQVSIGNGVTSVCGYAFNGFSGITAVLLPNSLTEIDSYAFCGCSGLRSISIPDRVSNVGGSAFRGCIGLTDLTIPGSVKTIGYEAFSGCSGLSTLTLKNGVTKIGGNAFSGCSGLMTVIIPDSVSDIGLWAFEGCTGLESVTISAGLKDMGSYAFQGCSALKSVTIRSGAEMIADHAFVGCISLTSVSIPGTVTSIGSYAFYGCSNLPTVTLQKGLISIGGSAFYGCSSLATLSIPAGVTSIGNEAFRDCSALQTVSIPGSLSTISRGMFEDCSSLSGITIPSGVTEIDNYAFSGCESLQNLSIPPTVTGIGTNAFSNCTSLTTVRIPDSVTSIGYSAFYNCSGMTTVTIPSSVTKIENYAFGYCNKLNSIYFAGCTPVIGSESFYGVTATAYYPSNWAASRLQNYGGTLTWVLWTLDTPVLTEAFNSATGVRVSWKPVAGAYGYRLLRKNLTKGETSWTIVGETTDCTFIDKSAVSASRYTYTVEAYSGSLVSKRDESGRTCTYIARADITKLAAVSNGVNITWSKPAGAKNFRVMRKTDGGTWKVIAVVEGTSYTDKDAPKGVKLWYTVRGVSMDNTVVINSYNATGWSLYHVNPPAMTEAFNSATGVRVSWKKVTGASKYRLLRKNVTKNETTWTTIGETKDLTLIDKSAVSAQRYTYTVECIDSNGRTSSAKNAAGRTCTYIAMSKITSISGVSNGVKLVWSKPAGAKNFRVFRKTDGSSTWTAIKDIQGTSFVDTTAQKNVKYWYTVRAITLAGDMYINSYNATGWSVTRK